MASGPYYHGMCAAELAAMFPDKYAEVLLAALAASGGGGGSSGNAINPIILTALTGDTSTTLDGQPVTGLTAGQSTIAVLILVGSNYALQWWLLNTGTAGAGEVQSAVNSGLKWTQVA